MEVLRNLSRRRLRSALTIFGIVIGVLAMTTMGAIAERFNAQFAAGASYFGSNVQVRGTATESILSPAKAAEIARVDGVTAAVPSVSVTGDSSTGSLAPADLVLSMEPGEYDHSPLQLHVAQGHVLTPGSRGEVVLGSDLAGQYHTKLGDRITLPVRPRDAGLDFVSHPFTVAGIYAPTHTQPDGFWWVTVPDAQMLLADSLPEPVRARVDPATLATAITVSSRPGASLAELNRIADRINAQVPGVRAIRPSETVASYQQGSALFTLVTTGAAVLALVIGGLSVMNTMIMAVTERVREIGLKKAVGARTRHILSEYLAEALLIGLAGGALGFTAGGALTALVNGAVAPNQLFLVTPRLAAVAIGFAAALGILAGILPALRASRLDPVVALRMQ